MQNNEFLTGEAAFELLAESARMAATTGREPVAARVKVVMLRESDGKFDERILGFKSFGRFLKAAEAVGVVVVTPGPPGGDLIVRANPHWKSTDSRSEGGAETATDHAPGAVASVNRSNRRLKQSLWRAFIDWDEGVKYVFDDERGLVQRHESLANSLPSTAHVITPVSLETQIGWAREFTTQEIDPPLREAILGILNSSNSDDRAAPMKNFFVFIRGAEGALTRWKWERQQRIVKTACEWAKSEGINPDLIFERAEQTAAAEGSKDASPALANAQRVSDPQDTDAELAAIRDLLHRAVDQMALSELREIPLRIKYIV